MENVVTNPEPDFTEEARRHTNKRILQQLRPLDYSTRKELVLKMLEMLDEQEQTRGSFWESLDALPEIINEINREEAEEQAGSCPQASRDIEWKADLQILCTLRKAVDYSATA